MTQHQQTREDEIAQFIQQHGGPYAVIADAIDYAVKRDGRLSIVSMGTQTQGEIAKAVARSIDAPMIQGTFAPVIRALHRRWIRRAHIAAHVYDHDPVTDAMRTRARSERQSRRTAAAARRLARYDRRHGITR
jgi:hypothetical protein